MSLNPKIVDELNKLKTMAESILKIVEVVDVFQNATKTCRRWWIHPINQNRQLQGDYENLVNEIREYGEDKFLAYTRMGIPQFDYILNLVKPFLTKYSNRQGLPEALRLFVTLRYLATGDSYSTLAFAYRIGTSTIQTIIPEVCNVLWDVLKPIYLPPKSTNCWLNDENKFCQYWNFPHCLGAIDGKFSYVDIGAYGSQSDGGIFTNSKIGTLLQTGQINFPSAAPLLGGNSNVPYFIVGDEAFPLKTYLLTPFSGRYLDDKKYYFNKRLSRARRVVENAFGILAARWRIYHRTIIAEPNTVDSIIKATVVLHNMLCDSRQHTYVPPTFVDRRCEANGIWINGSWRTEETTSRLSTIPPTLRLGPRNAPSSAIQYRDYLKDLIYNSS